ncbi:nuclear transport factor 2 family protein [Candidatus Thioglobus sp.]|nr:nuclear transport factor 2 family protein [Candidatus Thioglobus sp.]
MSIFNSNISSQEAGITPALLDKITDAYNHNDIDVVMSFFAEDAVFDHAAGPDINGTRFSGLDTIRTIFQGLFDNVESVHWTPIDTRVSGDKAYCEFHRVAKLKSGEIQDFLSVDVLTFRGGLIIHKDTFYKNRTS